MGTGDWPAPWYEPPAGATYAGDTPHSVSCEPIRNATNFVPSADFTRIRTEFLPSLRASLIALRTSSGAATFLPATSRMMSPVLKPWSAATRRDRRR